MAHESSSTRPTDQRRTSGLRRLSTALALALGVGFVAACSNSSDDPALAFSNRPVEEIYNAAMDALLQADYPTAASLFDEVERQHPYSLWASKAQIMAAYAHYQDNKYQDAIDTLDRFIQLHPGNEDIAYAYYLRAISYYEQISDVERDQRNTRLALEALDEVRRRFPNTDYARDVALKIDLARDHLAGKQMAIGRYYENQGEYLAAINRFKVVVDQYQTTTHVPEALHRLVESYLALGIIEEARANAAVLGYNYPGSEWYSDTWNLLVADGDVSPRPAPEPAPPPAKIAPETIPVEDLPQQAPENQIPTITVPSQPIPPPDVTPPQTGEVRS